MKQNIAFPQLVDSLKSVVRHLPDRRTGKNTTYSMEDMAMGAFAVFFTQCPSFLSFQTALKATKGKSNAETFFGIDKIPTDNHIRMHLDHVPPSLIFPVFNKVLDALQQTKILDSYRSYRNNLLIPLDGTWYHASKSICCDKCLTINHKDGSVTYYHSVITPVIVAPGNNKVISLPPEFITNQDGHTKQDCENTAAKRWIVNSGSKIAAMGATILGDDLYCKHTICSLLLEYCLNFILTCKPDSHKTLYQWLELLEPDKDIFTVIQEVWNGKYWEIHTFRYANNVPIRDSDDALRVNWCEVSIHTKQGELEYHNAFATNYKISAKNVAQIAVDGRARFKVENENNNTLKTKGYNLEHNFGHGKINLSMTLMTMNLLAFLFHTVLEYCDEKYRLLRRKLPTRKTFFDDIRALTRYLCFENWNGMLEFMLKGLERQHIPDKL